MKKKSNIEKRNRIIATIVAFAIIITFVSSVVAMLINIM